MRLKAALVFMFFGTVSCLQILDECMPKKSLETYIKGNEMKLRVWVPEIGDATFLTLISKNDLTGMSRKIEIKKNVTTVQTKDEETVSPERKIPIQNNSLPHGWVNFMVTSKENFTITVPDVNLTLIDIEDDVQDKYIMITGSNVTANCMLPTLHWEVSARQEAVIPLSPNASHDIWLFSRVPFTVKLAVESERSSQNSVFEAEYQQLSPFSVHKITLDSAIGQKLGSYYIKEGDSEMMLRSFPRKVTSLFLKANGSKDYIIIQGPNQEGGNTGGGQGEDENRVGPCIPWMAINGVLVLFVFCVLATLLFIKRKPRAECREVEDCVDDSQMVSGDPLVARVNDHMESTNLSRTGTQITEELTTHSNRKLTFIERLISVVKGSLNRGL